MVLETIMSAPLVVAQWISSQYYFSTVEPDIFGAGDKVLHNPVGGAGVVVGQPGDLAIGLSMQSVMLGEQRAHDPLRLLAVVQASATAATVMGGCSKVAAGCPSSAKLMWVDLTTSPERVRD